jgi:hypothetical protein
MEEVDHDSDRIVVLSDVHLDRKEVLDSLHTLFTGDCIRGQQVRSK